MTKEASNILPFVPKQPAGPATAEQKFVLIDSKDLREAIAALDYIATYGKPPGGEDRFNSLHLWEIAAMLRRAL